MTPSPRSTPAILLYRSILPLGTHGEEPSSHGSSSRFVLLVFTARPLPRHRGFRPIRLTSPVPVDFQHYEFYPSSVPPPATPRRIWIPTGAGVRVQLGRPSACAAPCHPALWCGCAFEQSGLSAVRHGLHGVRTSRYRSGSKDRHHQGVEARPPDRHIHPAVLEVAHGRAPTRAWESASPGTSCPYGCRRTSASGSSMAARVKRSFRKPASTTFPTAVFW